MNYGMIRYILGWVLKVVGLLMLLPCLIALIYGEGEGLIYLLTALPAFLAGQLRVRPDSPVLPYRMEPTVSPLPRPVYFFARAESRGKHRGQRIMLAPRPRKLAAQEMIPFRVMLSSVTGFV